MSELERITREFANTWATLMVDLPVDYDCTLQCGEANAAAALYRAIGDHDTANLIIQVHDTDENCDGDQEH